MGDQDVRGQPAGVRTGVPDRARPGAREPRPRGGIRSTGVSSSPAVADLVHELLAAAGAPVEDERAGAVAALEPVPRLFGDAEPAALFARDPAYGDVVCPCEQVTAAEVAAALCMRLPARSVAGLRKRTHAAAGRCQGATCLAGLASRLAGPWLTRSRSSAPARAGGHVPRRSPSGPGRSSSSAGPPRRGRAGDGDPLGRSGPAGDGPGRAGRDRGRRARHRNGRAPTRIGGARPRRHPPGGRPAGAGRVRAGGARALPAVRPVVIGGGRLGGAGRGRAPGNGRGGHRRRAGRHPRPDEGVGGGLRPRTAHTRGGQGRPQGGADRVRPGRLRLRRRGARARPRAGSERRRSRGRRRAHRLRAADRRSAVRGRVAGRGRGGGPGSARAHRRRGSIRPWSS